MKTHFATNLRSTTQPRPRQLPPPHLISHLSSPPLATQLALRSGTEGGCGLKGISHERFVVVMVAAWGWREINWSLVHFWQVRITLIAISLWSTIDILEHLLLTSFTLKVRAPASVTTILSHTRLPLRHEPKPCFRSNRRILILTSPNRTWPRPPTRKRYHRHKMLLIDRLPLSCPPLLDLTLLLHPGIDWPRSTIPGPAATPAWRHPLPQGTGLLILTVKSSLNQPSHAQLLRARNGEASALWYHSHGILFLVPSDPRRPSSTPSTLSSPMHPLSVANLEPTSSRTDAPTTPRHWLLCFHCVSGLGVGRCQVAARGLARL